MRYSERVLRIINFSCNSHATETTLVAESLIFDINFGCKSRIISPIFFMNIVAVSDFYCIKMLQILYFRLTNKNIYVVQILNFNN